MTTIAWDGTTLAVDRQSTASYGFKYEMCKLHVMEESRAPMPRFKLFTSCGDQGLNHEFARWLKSGMPHADVPKVDEEKAEFSGTLIEMVPETTHPRVMMINRQGILIPTVERLYTDGSGRDFAMMAMHLGKNAVDAILLTMQFDSSTGLGVDWARLDGTRGRIVLDRRPLTVNYE